MASAKEQDEEAAASAAPPLPCTAPCPPSGDGGGSPAEAADVSPELDAWARSLASTRSSATPAASPAPASILRAGSPAGVGRELPLLQGDANGSSLNAELEPVAENLRLFWERRCPLLTTAWRFGLMVCADLILWYLSWRRSVPSAIGIGCSIWAVLLACWIIFVAASWLKTRRTGGCAPHSLASVDMPLSAGNTGTFSYQRFGECLHTAGVFDKSREPSRWQKVTFAFSIIRALANTSAITFVFLTNCWRKEPLSYMEAAALYISWFEFPIICLVVAIILGHLAFLLPWSSRLGKQGMTRSSLFMQHPSLAMLDFSWPMNVSGFTIALQFLGYWSVLRFLPLAHPVQLLEKCVRNWWHGPALVGIVFAVPVITQVAIISVMVKAKWMHEIKWDKLQEEEHGLLWLVAFYRLFLGRYLVELVLLVNAIVGISPSRSEIAINAMLQCHKREDPHFAAGWRRVLGQKLVRKLGMKGFIFYLTLSPDDVSKLLYLNRRSHACSQGANTAQCQASPPPSCQSVTFQSVTW